MFDFPVGAIAFTVIVGLVFFYERQRRSAIKDHMVQLNILLGKIEIKNKCIHDLNIKLESFTKNPSKDCQELLSAISSGVAVLKIEVIDHSDMFIWKPGKK